MADEQAAPATEDKQLLLQKIYIKDISWESPKSPEVFTSSQPANTQLNIGSANRSLEDSMVEVTLTLTVESKSGDDTLFLVEVVQAGVFTMKGYSEQERAVLLGSFCPGSLFPYAREAVSDIVGKGGFPPLLLQPINFDALYAQALQQRQAKEAGGQPLSVEMPGGGTAEIPADAAASADTSKGNGDTH